MVALAICFTGMTVFSSCEKDENENFYCVNTIKSSPKNSSLSKSEMDVVKYLFNRNQLDYTKYQFTQFQKDELGHHHIRCFQFANNLLVFTSDAIFHFDKNDNYYSLSGDLINTLNFNTKPSMKQDDVIEKYIDIVQHDETFLAYLDILVEIAKVDETVDVIHIEDIIEGCFDVEFGYYDLNASVSYTDEKYTKAWKINSNKYDYPFAYINDENSEVIYYDNGIRF
jgi:Zn-dependent metalloprotease